MKINMKIPISIKLENIKAEVTPIKGVIKDIVGFVELQIEDTQGNVVFIVRGCTIKVKAFNNRPTFTVNAPAYKSGFGYKTSFIMENKSLWFDTVEAILKEFSEKTGGLTPEDYLNSSENVDPKDIPV